MLQPFAVYHWHKFVTRNAFRVFQKLTVSRLLKAYGFHKFRFVNPSKHFYNLANDRGAAKINRDTNDSFCVP